MLPAQHEQPAAGTTTKQREGEQDTTRRPANADLRARVRQFLAIDMSAELAKAAHVCGKDRADALTLMWAQRVTALQKCIVALEARNVTQKTIDLIGASAKMPMVSSPCP